MSQTVFITGASAGIGKATARHFSQQGWNVAATVRNPQDGAKLEGDNVLVTKLDLLDPATIQDAVAAAEKRFGSIDVLVNNAGYGAYGPLEATPMSVVRRQFEVNLFGLIEVTKAVLPGMRRQKSGTIVNVSSVGGRMTYPFGTLYHGSKWAVEGLSESLNFEARLFGGSVKIVEPGGVKTDFSGRSFVFTEDTALEAYQPMIDAMKAVMENQDTSQHQNPEDVAEIIWTAATDGTDRLRYISGDGAEVLLNERFSNDQDEAFIAGQRAQFGL
ncbi:MAG: SDR family oxidoreductase [Planctomycetaceae bacterium]|nr:SDR family oxidoreductase [Planctomycetaceae bacterium]